MEIKTLIQLTDKLTEVGIVYSVKASGHLLQFKTVSYSRNGKTVHADFYRGGNLIGIWR